MQLVRIGRVESQLTDVASAPKQGHEGSPEAWLVFDRSVAQALEGIQAGDEIIVLTWLDRARRDVLRVHPARRRPQPRAGRVQHAFAAPAQPDRTAPCQSHPHRWPALPRAQSRSCGRHPDRRRQARPHRGTGVTEVMPTVRSGRWPSQASCSVQSSTRRRASSAGRESIGRCPPAISSMSRPSRSRTTRAWKSHGKSRSPRGQRTRVGTSGQLS